MQEEKGCCIDFVMYPYKGQAFTVPVYSKSSSLSACTILSSEKEHTQNVFLCFKTVFAVLCDDVNTTNESKWGALRVLDEI